MEENKQTEEVSNLGSGENVAPETKKPELSAEEKEKLRQQKEFFYRLRQGATFLKFIYNDIERQKKEHLNRAQRRRFEKELRKGNFSKELVEVYYTQIDKIEAFITEQLNPTPKPVEVDGAKLLEEMRAKEAEKGNVKEENNT